ncbi:MAG: Gfo/Idh/MocA family oxidoreductase [Spirochaetaceae bacterium]|nr:Gfo/Idh/MocA family oxidoreductase [Spirochaetaceae bacterium]
MSRKIRMGMVGGGRDAFIGAVHRMAAALDGHIELVCGAFSSDPERSRASGADLYLPANRVYGDYQEMMAAEAKLPAGERMDFVSIVTPNYVHFPVAKAALEGGFHVMSDKPMTFDLAEAKELAALVESTGLQFGLTHNYTGYPMVKEARHMVRNGAIGAVRKVVVEYPQGWLASLIESDGQKQASWRTDPARAGASSCMGDIGTHAENLMEYITGLKIASLCADLTTMVEGRQLEDDGNVLVRLDNGARGVLYASQISAGEENPLTIRVYGELAGLEWHQEEPNTLTVKWGDRHREVRRTGVGELSDASAAHTRLPAGHPEGFVEAFANLYRNYALALQARLAGEQPDPEHLDFPTVQDGVRGMAFITACVASSASDQKWTELEA